MYYQRNSLLEMKRARIMHGNQRTYQSNHGNAGGSRARSPLGVGERPRGVSALLDRDGDRERRRGEGDGLRLRLIERPPLDLERDLDLERERPPYRSRLGERDLLYPDVVAGRLGGPHLGSRLKTRM